MTKFLLSILMLLSFELQAQDSIATFDSKIYIGMKILNSDSTPYTGLLIDRWNSARVKRSARVEQGIIEGTAKEFYENGQVRYIKVYKHGKLTSTFTEYFSNGEIKLMVDVGDQCREGGNTITKILYAYYTPEGKYITKVKTKARIVMMTSDKLYSFYNEELPFHRHDGYAIYDSSLKNYGIFIEDSRTITGPSESNHVKMPVRWKE